MPEKNTEKWRNETIRRNEMIEAKVPKRWGDFNQSKIISDVLAIFGSAEPAASWLGIDKTTLSRRKTNHNPVTTIEFLSILDLLTTYDVRYEGFKPLLDSLHSELYNA